MVAPVGMRSVGNSVMGAIPEFFESGEHRWRTFQFFPVGMRVNEHHEIVGSDQTG